MPIYFFISLCFLLTIILIVNTQSISNGELIFNFMDRDFPTSSPNPTPLTSFLEIPISPVILNTVKRSCVEICLGTLPQCFYLVIQSNSFYLWVVDQDSNQPAEKKFDAAQSFTIIQNKTEVTLKYYNNFVLAYTAKDDLTIERQKLGRIFFAVSIAADAFKDYEGMLGLGYTPQSYEAKYSLIEQLYEQKMIFHKVFTQSFTSSEKGELSFGKIPRYIIDDYKKYGRCQALDKIRDGQSYKNPNWQCQINGVFYGKHYERESVMELQNSKVTFFSYRKRALVPLTFFEKLETNYFGKYISNGKCEKVQVGKYDIYSCKEDIIDAPEMNFIFGDWVMQIPRSELFKYNEQNQRYEFILYHKRTYEKWTLGRPIVKMFHMIYDASNQQIGFYNKDFVLYIGSAEIVPPQSYDYIPDKEPKPKPNNNKENKPPKKKPPTLKPYIENQDKIIVPKENNDSLSTAFLIQILLLIFVIIVALAFMILTIWMYIRYRRKTHFPNHDYFSQQADQMLSN